MNLTESNWKMERNGSASNWLKHKLDYWDTCAKLREDIHVKQTTLNRQGKQRAVMSHKYHLQMGKHCTSSGRE